MLKLAQKLLSNYPDVMLMAARGFANHQLINWLQNSSWHYCLRLPCDVMIHGATSAPPDARRASQSEALDTALLCEVFSDNLVYAIRKCLRHCRHTCGRSEASALVQALCPGCDGASRHPIELKYLWPPKAEAIFYNHVGLWLDGECLCHLVLANVKGVREPWTVLRECAALMKNHLYKLSGNRVLAIRHCEAMSYCRRQSASDFVLKSYF